MPVRRFGVRRSIGALAETPRRLALLGGGVCLLGVVLSRRR
jgi:hypothetical protein